MVNVTVTPLSGSLALDGSVGAAPTPSATTIGYVWASGTNNATLYYTDGAATTTSLLGGGSATIGGTVSAGSVPYAASTDTLADGFDFKLDNNSLWFGVTPASISTAQDSVYVGINAGADATTGDYNVGMGRRALQNSTTGQRNTAIGFSASRYNTTGTNNVAIGMEALRNTIGHTYNVAIGSNSMLSVGGNVAGNVAVGAFSLYYPSGNYNTALGYCIFKCSYRKSFYGGYN